MSKTDLTTQKIDIINKKIVRLNEKIAKLENDLEQKNGNNSNSINSIQFELQFHSYFKEIKLILTAMETIRKENKW